MSDDFNPAPGTAIPLALDLRRIVAPNPSPMTYRGTNTYLIGQSNIAVIDPGPDDPNHLSAILSALEPGQRITHILTTHAHRDHTPLAAPLSEQTGAPVYAYGGPEAGRSAVMADLAATGLMRGGEGVDEGFTPDITLKDNEIITGTDWQIRALWTPGHFGNHLCFEMGGAIFCGDLVMGWASSLVSPPDGDLTDFMASCRRLQECGAKVLYPGHGAPITDPAARLKWLIAHRETREAQILAQIAHGPATASQIAQAIYTDTNPALLPAAVRNVLAHLIDLMGKKHAAPQGALHADTPFRALQDRHQNN
ncbi:MBL fold metallo-hydrolase [Roseovarius sp. LXJ103]|uniref:MBL fold metallo-hydrolase n=1 Tax=Roseovarius carneus TaxID=2853164 RepID=UPI000D60A2EB|nr:MBL fold metallo-hydrolase [Roseovarius carneus]MBZ8119277.1 MBL fold metallo-hydrolase [Roseovarius carneus]PWE35101.1 MBL fold metallo-hydrolase [Pelagicola sp. LXJ1103]